MTRSRFVRPDTVLLPLSDGDWLLVKKRLNNGEQRELFRRIYIRAADGSFVVDEDGNPKVDITLIGFALVTTYLVDWSLTDHSGEKMLIAQQPPELIAATVDALEPEEFAEVRTAVEQHDERQRQAREQE